MTEPLLDRLRRSEEPSIRYLFLTRVQQQDPASADALGLQEDIRTSARALRLLRAHTGAGDRSYHPYAKWFGAHWVLAALADIGYPAGDSSLVPLREDVLAWLLGEEHWRHVQTIDGRVRRCASQEANALFALLTLGLADDRTNILAERLAVWQWPDGGWNCDKRRAASHSSFMETLIPLRALALHARLAGDAGSREASCRAAEVFLKRELFRRQHDGQVIDEHFLRLHYPCYWHYDILFGLKVLAEAGFIGDARCSAALDLLESKRLPDGGFPAEDRYYRSENNSGSGRSPVDWGPTSKRRLNEWVTVDALFVLRASGRSLEG